MKKVIITGGIGNTAWSNDPTTRAARAAGGRLVPPPPGSAAVVDDTGAPGSACVWGDGASIDSAGRQPEPSAGREGDEIPG